MSRSKYRALSLVAFLTVAGGCQEDSTPTANACTSTSGFGASLQPQIRQRENRQTQHHGRPDLEVAFHAHRCEPQAPRIDRLFPSALMTQ